ncbi:MAG: 2Fe-2S iron-sulfur cluster binding domain-containing protein, partial [Bacteroidales bacterium]|nr:2Fe-2S iron-sulfur cluster binding domain-containing protein [Bacteroidales bacterium]
MILNIGIGTVILSSIVVFLIIILVLVLLLLYVRKKLVPSGPVKLVINDDKEIDTSAGSTLLATLSNNKIFLPAACGGGGTCGMCRCQVES